MSLFGQSSSGSLFGNKPQPQQIPNLSGVTQTQQGSNPFGSSTSTSIPAQGGGLFGTAASQPQQSGSLFGSTATNQQQQGPSLFSPNNSQVQTQSSGLFGNNSQQQGGSLFTKPTTSTQLTGQPGGAFGASTAPQNKPALSLFGPSQNQTQSQQTSLFGGNNTAQATQNQNSSLFPNMSSKLPPLGQTQQQQQSVPGVRIDVSQMRGTTRFVDLHDELQKQIEQIDGFIQQQISYKEQCDAMMPAHGSNVQSIPNDVKFLKDMVDGVESSTESNARAVSQLKELVNKDADDARLSFRAVENLKLPSYFHHNGSFGSGGGSGSSTSEGEGTPDLISYFSNTALDMANTLSSYERNINEIESHLKLVEANAMTEAQQMMLKKSKDNGEKGVDDQVKELAAVLREFESGIMGVAGRVGQLREYMQGLELTIYK